MDKKFEILFYQSAEEDVSVNALIKDETIWLNQKGMAELFGCSTDNISLHLKNIFADGELDKNSVTEKISATATEIVYIKADKTKKNMGLTTWKNAPNGRILQSNVVIAKNYLEEKQIRQLERAVTGYFDYIEDLIERENTFTMEEFIASVNEFLSFRRYDILRDKGKISGKMAKEKATTEYMEFNKTQTITSDFDKAVNQMLKAGEEE